MLKPPSPGSTGDSTSIPPPASCSPFSGKSSSNTKSDSFAGGSGVDTAYTVTGVNVPVVAGQTTDSFARGEPHRGPPPSCPPAPPPHRVAPSPPKKKV